MSDCSVDDDLRTFMSTKDEKRLLMTNNRIPLEEIVSLKDVRRSCLYSNILLLSYIRHRRLVYTRSCQQSTFGVRYKFYRASEFPNSRHVDRQRETHYSCRYI